jgi:nitronate monooxygenase
MWKDRRILDLFGIELPIIQAPMAGPVLADMAIAVAEVGGLVAALRLLSLGQTRAELAKIRAATTKPININFFCHIPPAYDEAREMAWRKRLRPFYVELGIDPDEPIPAGNRAPFDDAFCQLVEEVRPEIVSFHFGLPVLCLARPRQGDRSRGYFLGDDGARGDLAGRTWLRRDHRSRF